MALSLTKFVMLAGLTHFAFYGLAGAAFGADATPFTCGNGQSARIVNTGESHAGIGNTKDGVTAVSDGRQGRCGVDFTNINEKFSTIILWAKDPVSVAGYVNTKLCFTDSEGSFTVQKKLSQYRVSGGAARFFKEYELDASDFGSRASQATLVRLVEVLNTPNNVPGNITFGGIWFNDRPYKTIIPREGNGGCDSAQACSKEEDPK
ncbi:MAG: hypothetical protein JST89_19515 [Cyanobacteria bacterium SZAS-4]|nr:hypothetical protein [Cyanobacteria bacterium SZAS-4]